jgi:hypothetical protein
MRRGLALVLELAACTSPEVQARNFLDSQYPPGADAAELQADLASRGYWRIAGPCVPAAPGQLAYCLAGEPDRPPAPGTTCMVREKVFFLASGNSVCWTEDASGRILTTHADWLVNLPPAVAS